MKKIKVFVSLLLILCLSFSLCSCGGSKIKMRNGEELVNLHFGDLQESFTPANQLIYSSPNGDINLYYMASAPGFGDIVKVENNTDSLFEIGYSDYTEGIVDSHQSLCCIMDLYYSLWLKPFGNEKKERIEVDTSILLEGYELDIEGIEDSLFEKLNQMQESERALCPESLNADTPENDAYWANWLAPIGIKKGDSIYKDNNVEFFWTRVELDTYTDIGNIYLVLEGKNNSNNPIEVSVISTVLDNSFSFGEEEDLMEIEPNSASYGTVSFNITDLLVNFISYIPDNISFRLKIGDTITEPISLKWNYKDFHDISGKEYWYILPENQEALTNN